MQAAFKWLVWLVHYMWYLAMVVGVSWEVFHQCFVLTLDYRASINVLGTGIHKFVHVMKRPE